MDGLVVCTIGWHASVGGSNPPVVNTSRDARRLGGRLKCARSARAVQLFGHLAVLETHTLRY